MEEDVEGYVSVVEGLGEEAKRLVRADHFDSVNITARQVAICTWVVLTNKYISVCQTHALLVISYAPIVHSYHAKCLVHTYNGILLLWCIFHSTHVNSY